jgi:4-aminobutyrate aminotransferase-like enzyme
MLDFPAGDSDGDGVARELAALRRALAARGDLAAVVIEPIQSRGGIVVPPGGYLRGLRAICDELGIVLIFDEIYTGFGRTGSWFACMHDGIVPDIICIGKAMGSGFPISAIAARADVMDAWPVSRGEALHTSTYLGNPMGCAAALATIDELERLRLPERARELAPAVEERLQAFLGKHGVRDVRGRGLMWGVELRDAAQADAAVKAALRLGLIVLQTGRNGNVISVTPPLVIGRDDLDRALDLLENAIAETGGPP